MVRPGAGTIRVGAVHGFLGVWESGRGGDLGRDFVALGVGDVMNGAAGLGGLRGNGE